jgi:hypothetical protein
MSSLLDGEFVNSCSISVLVLFFEGSRDVFRHILGSNFGRPSCGQTRNSPRSGEQHTIMPTISEEAGLHMLKAFSLLLYWVVRLIYGGHRQMSSGMNIK